MTRPPTGWKTSMPRNSSSDSTRPSPLSPFNVANASKETGFRGSTVKDVERFLVARARAKDETPVDLSGKDLSGIRLSGKGHLVLRKISFEGCNFSNADIERVIFIKCSFREAHFENASLKNVHFHDSGCHGTSFSLTFLDSVLFSGKSPAFASFSFCRGKDVSIRLLPALLTTRFLGCEEKLSLSFVFVPRKDQRRPDETKGAGVAVTGISLSENGLLIPLTRTDIRLLPQVPGTVPFRNLYPDLWQMVHPKERPPWPERALGPAPKDLRAPGGP